MLVRHLLIVWSFDHFYSEGTVFFLLICKSSLYNLDISPLLALDFADIFSHLVTCLYTLSPSWKEILNFDVVKFFSFFLFPYGFGLLKLLNNHFLASACQMMLGKIGKMQPLPSGSSQSIGSRHRTPTGCDNWWHLEEGHLAPPTRF